MKSLFLVVLFSCLFLFLTFFDERSFLDEFLKNQPDSLQREVPADYKEQFSTESDALSKVTKKPTTAPKELGVIKKNAPRKITRLPRVPENLLEATAERESAPENKTIAPDIGDLELDLGVYVSSHATDATYQQFLDPENRAIKTKFAKAKSYELQTIAVSRDSETLSSPVFLVKVSPAPAAGEIFHYHLARQSGCKDLKIQSSLAPFDMAHIYHSKSDGQNKCQFTLVVSESPELFIESKSLAFSY